jgi:hypothetical protein
MRNEIARPPETGWFKWTPAAGTDITATWRRAGWVPPSEDPVYLAKWREWKRKINGDLDESAMVASEEFPLNVTMIPKTLSRRTK